MKQQQFAECQPATTELVALALKARPDWAQHEQDLWDALTLAEAQNWSWPRRLVYTAKLIVIADSKPADLRAAVSAPGSGGRFGRG